MPITHEDKKHEHYEKGVSCHHCYNRRTPEQLKRYEDREKQIQLAKSKGEEHIGGQVANIIENRRKLKKYSKTAKLTNLLK